MQTQVVIGGDVFPAKIEGRALRQRLGLTDQPDVFMFTLDAALDAGPKRANYSCIAFAPQSLDELKLARTNLVVTASNHITDFGDSGVVATLAELERRGFAQVGSGVNRAQAERATVLDLPAGRVAVLAFAETAPRVWGLAAGENSAGIRPLEPETALAAIAAAKREADWVWVVLHWGEEFVRFPDPPQRALARQMIDRGADLVLASHTHVPLGYEQYRNGTIFFGLGNFIYPPYTEERGFVYRWNLASREAVVVYGTHDGHHWTWTPKPVLIDAHGFPRLGQHRHCPDYARILPTDLDRYAEVFPSLRRSERWNFYMQRLMFMSWHERWVRLMGLKSKLSAGRAGNGQS